MVIDDSPSGVAPPPASPADRELTEAEIEALEDAEDLRIGLERLELMKTEGTVSWESVKAEYGL